MDLLVLCDAVNQSHEGKLNILGVFDLITVSDVPAAHPRCMIAGRLRFDRTEDGDHDVALRIIDADGIIVAGPYSDIVQVPQQMEFLPATNIIIELPNFVLPTLGEYAVELFVDGEMLAAFTLSVRLPA